MIVRREQAADRAGLRLPLGTPEEFAALIAADSKQASWRSLAQEIDLRPE